MFPCTGCGVCCRHIENVIEMREPDVCRVDKMFDIKYHQYR